MLYICSCCNFETKLKTNYVRHLSTQKHISTFGNNKYMELNFNITDIFNIYNSKLYLKNTDISPCFIQGPANVNLDNLCNFYNLPIGKVTSRSTLYRIKTYTKPIYHEQFADEIFKIKLFIFVIILVIIGLYAKDRYKNN